MILLSGLLQEANGIETDVQRTGDGVLVLFHDDTVDVFRMVLERFPVTPWRSFAG
ncbi:MAG: hypothetical protein E7404_02915 [Ruminococcaceae bacterium]|nr:hypothetical protein [Oscillospiraceae bacterium]